MRRMRQKGYRGRVAIYEFPANERTAELIRPGVSTPAPRRARGSGWRPHCENGLV